jgi:Tol biopolymer transport system component
VSIRFLLFIVITITCSCIIDKNPLNYGDLGKWQYYRKAKLLYSNADGVYLLDLKSDEGALIAKNGEIIDYPPRTGDQRSWADEACWSPDGKRIVYVEGNSGTDYSQISVMDADGNNKRTVVYEGIPLKPDWSPDGSEIVYTKHLAKFGSNPEVFIINADGTNERQLTNLPGEVGNPSFSRDGQKIIFVSEIIDSVYNTQLFMMNRDGSDIEQLTGRTNSLKSVGDASWSPVSDEIVFSGKDSKEPDSEIFLLKLSDSQIFILTNRNVIELDLWSNNVSPSWSNDGWFIIYSQHFFGLSPGARPLPSVWIMKADGSEQKQLMENALNPDIYIWLY